MSKIVRGILKDYKHKDLPLDQAEKEIDAIHKSKVPKKKKCICNKENLWKCDCGAEVYNQCISDFHKEG